jgi:hypothetical protein
MRCARTSSLAVLRAVGDGAPGLREKEKHRVKALLSMQSRTTASRPKQHFPNPLPDATGTSVFTRGRCGAWPQATGSPMNTEVQSPSGLASQGDLREVLIG